MLPIMNSIENRNGMAWLDSFSTAPRFTFRHLYLYLAFVSSDLLTEAERTETEPRTSSRAVHCRHRLALNSTEHSTFLPGKCFGNQPPSVEYGRRLFSISFRNAFREKMQMLFGREEPGRSILSFLCLANGSSRLAGYF